MKTNLLTRTISQSIIIPERVLKHEVMPAWSAFYFLPTDCVSYLDVPENKRFGLVNSPSANPLNLFYGQWTYSVFKVVYLQVPKVDSEPCRYYRQVVTRALDADEIKRFERILDAN